ncbi:MAG TPA: vitamin K epoxide reductase family protein [Ktedonobacteraceae bacterium]|jgi:uncharacterized membrane protein|nr:vitamin K epoxide reductase family protein [Ktedonosporobacter sp.]HZU67079.1 vitamin K epoxide reductase family protein [Ktedonobacteraceae bacterium]
MKILQRSKAQLFLLLCSIIGIGISIYLTTVHYENVPLVCSANGVVDCAKVLSSPFSVIPGTSIPITVPGLAWSLLSAFLAIYALYQGMEHRWIPVAQFAWALVGMLTVLYLVYIEIVRLHTICAWCTAMHVLILLMFLVTIVQLQMRHSDDVMEFATEDEEQAYTTPSHSK